MTPTELQQWLGAHGQPVVVDGLIGNETRTAIKAAFVNLCAPAVTNEDIVSLAIRLGCTTKQIKAVAKVESGGGGYDKAGRPKILFERHYFHRLTKGRWSPSPFSQSKGGGYRENSWDKLLQAVGRNVDAAFASCSWGKFQVMGAHWQVLEYPSPIEMAYSCVTGEGAHYEMLARFIEKNSLKGPLRSLSSNSDDCRHFARRYNGPAYEKGGYHLKLAKAMV